MHLPFELKTRTQNRFGIDEQSECTLKPGNVRWEAWCNYGCFIPQQDRYSLIVMSQGKYSQRGDCNVRELTCLVVCTDARQQSGWSLVKDASMLCFGEYGWDGAHGVGYRETERSCSGWQHSTTFPCNRSRFDKPLRWC